MVVRGQVTRGATTRGSAGVRPVRRPCTDALLPVRVGVDGIKLTADSGRADAALTVGEPEGWEKPA
jgi:hypothetical protein